MNITKSNIEDVMAEAVKRLLNMARESTRNKISDNCRFILTEIIESPENFHVQRIERKRLNDKKVPVTLKEIMPALTNMYDNLYDINLYVYRSKRSMTIVDIRYYLKSSLDKDYREKVLYNAPMLHCKVAHPPWLFSEKNEKFDINWEHFEGLNRLRLLWLKMRLSMRGK